MLILRKLLNLHVATIPKKATIQVRLYKHCTKLQHAKHTRAWATLPI